MEKICLHCKKIFIPKQVGYWRRRKFCSLRCWNLYQRGKKRPPFSKEWKRKIGKAMKGRKFSNDHRRKISEALKRVKKPWTAKRNREMIGEKHPQWKGDKVGYGALHIWVYKALGKPKICTNCGTNKKLQWANKSGQYKRDLNDWISLCASCHKQYDLNQHETL